MKLSGWTIIILGLSLGLSVLSYALFQVYLPHQEAAQNNRDYKAKLDMEAAKLPAAEKRVQKAIEQVQLAAQKWDVYVATKTPPSTLASGGINIFVNPYQLVVDTPKFRNKAQAAFNAQVRKGGVRVVSAPEIPHPSDSEGEILANYYNYPAFSYPVVLWELGAVTVRGTYEQITRNVREWSRMPNYLAVVDGLAISGTSPNLTGTYNVTLVGFIRGRNIYPMPPVALAATTQGQGQPGTGGTPSGASRRGGLGIP